MTHSTLSESEGLGAFRVTSPPFCFAMGFLFPQPYRAGVLVQQG